MRRGGGGGVVIWHAEKRIEDEDQEEKECRKKKRRSPSSCTASQASPHLPSLISPSSRPRLPISSFWRRCKTKQSRARGREEKKKSSTSSSSRSCWLAKIIAVLSGVVLRSRPSLSYLTRCHELRYNLGWRGLVMGNGEFFSISLIFPFFSPPATIECTPKLLIPAAILCRQSPVPALRSKMPPTSLCAWPRLLGQQSSADLLVTHAGGFAAERQQKM